MKKIYQKVIKGCIDRVLGLIALIILSPVLLITAIVIKIKLGSPVIFKQERAGLNSKPFYLYKFRSMSNEKDDNGKLLPDEVRLGSFGKKLRATSLDELPSLVNVVKGELSIIGPRPLPTRYLKYYTKEESHRHDVKPGITGWAQVNGRNYVSWEDKFKMDLEYIDKLSFLFDIKIIFKTVQVVFSHSNVDTGSFIEHNGKIYRPLDVERKGIQFQ